MSRARLITIEGLDGAGKSTLARGLAKEIARRGKPVELLREPGGSPLGERIRELVKDPTLAIDDRAEALLYAAARAQLVRERIMPLLESGTWVLLDRYVDSSLAYQGAGRSLGLEAIGAVNALATDGLEADRTLLLRIDPRTGRARLDARGERPDRLEQAGESFFAAVALAYDELARQEPPRIRVIDAEHPPAQVLSSALAAIADLLSGS